ncbi:hypothetical protein LPJ56_006578, partial [Coemansia sp. RSA 2599]
AENEAEDEDEAEDGAESNGEGSGDSDAEQPSADGSGQEEPPARRRNNRECAICIQDIDVSPTAAATLFGRAPYMVTPCHHVYHTECLTRWMEMKLECPVCRAPLPPI